MALIEVKVMKMLEEMEFQDKDGNRVEYESEAYVCKVTSRITLTDMVLIVNEVGASIDMAGDGHIGGD